MSIRKWDCRRIRFSLENSYGPTGINSFYFNLSSLFQPIKLKDTYKWNSSRPRVSRDRVPPERIRESSMKSNPYLRRMKEERSSSWHGTKTLNCSRIRLMEPFSNYTSIRRLCLVLKLSKTTSHQNVAKVWNLWLEITYGKHHSKVWSLIRSYIWQIPLLSLNSLVMSHISQVFLRSLKPLLVSYT